MLLSLNFEILKWLKIKFTIDLWYFYIDRSNLFVQVIEPYDPFNATGLEDFTDFQVGKDDCTDRYN